MSPFALNLEKNRLETSLVRIEPAINAFGSMLLISKDEDNPGIHDWIARTRAQMTSEEQFRHKLVTIGFHYSILPQKTGGTFEAYMDSLEATPPSVFRERLLKAYSETCITEESWKDQGKPVDWEEILTSAKNYVDFLRYRFGEELTDEEMETRAYQYVIDPAALKQLVTSHIRWFWKNHLQAEWTRVRPMLEESVRAFKKVDLSDMTRLEAMRFITGQDLEDTKWAELIEKAKTITFVPNAHIGPYIHKSCVEDSCYVYFGARLPEGSDVRIPELDRAEIVARLSALADDTRLRILQMIAERKEMRAQDIIDETGLSQPSVSRYLSQLTASGYLQERRANGAKAYTLNRERIEKTLKAVSAFLLDHI